MTIRFLSLFSGIEAASCAWLPLGWECVGVAEIEPFPCSVLKHHYKDVPNLGDITKITHEQTKTLGRIDLVVGGFPCQDLSVAGKRKGLKNEDGSATRSGLFFDAMRIVRYADPRWLLLENVPGIYSSNGGRDFASVAGEILGVEFGVPLDGWQNAGVAASERGLLEWATLDAQFFGVPQRRRRMFALADFGDWRSRGPVLFERHSVSGHPAPSRQTRKDVAPTLSARTKGGGGLGTDFDLDGGLITHTLRGEGFDASEDGTGRGTPLVPVAFSIQAGALRENPNSGPDGVGVQEDIGYTLEARAEVQAIAFDCKSSGQSGFGVGEIASTMRAMGHSNSHQNGGGHQAVAFGIPGNWIGRKPENGGNAVEPMHNVSPCQTKTDQHGVVHGMQVRRLTPMECERLQGFPDFYTAVPHRGKPAADGPRYKALGNSMAVPCMAWIGSRIQAVESIAQELEIARTA